MDIPYRKIFIYLLTFLGYIYSGYGSGILRNLRDAVLAAESTFGNVFTNVINVAKGFKSLHDVFDAAVEEDCVFKCPTGIAPRLNKHHTPSANGCGSLGVSIPSEYLPVGEMTNCCNKHDICYDTCNKEKELCDVEFKRCLYQFCEGYKNALGLSTVNACKGAAKMLFTATLALGCKSYKDAQSKACLCPSSYGWKDKKNNYKYTRGDEL